MPRRRSFGPGFQIFLLTSAARTTSGQGGAMAVNLQAQVTKLAVTAVSGTTPNLVVTVEESRDGATGWTTHSTFAAKTGTGTEILDYKKRTKEFVRVVWTITGTTPSFTFSVQAADDVTRLQ